MNNIYKQKGITLIALIITVIILLILAGTAISIAVNGGDLFGKAQEAREAWNESVADEENNIKSILSYVDLYSGATVPQTLSVGDTVSWTPSGSYEWNKEYTVDDMTETLANFITDFWGSSALEFYSGTYARMGRTRQLFSGTQVPTGATTEWTAEENNMDLTVSSWKVLNISEDRKTVTLVAAAPTQSSVVLMRSSRI